MACYVQIAAFLFLNEALFVLIGVLDIDIVELALIAFRIPMATMNVTIYFTSL
jgi:hypothetical protein